MRQRAIYLPELAIFGVTRGMLGLGIGLLVGDRLGRDHRRFVGTAMLAVGALSTIPLALRLLRRGTIDSDPTEHRRRGETASMAH